MKTSVINFLQNSPINISKTRPAFGANPSDAPRIRHLELFNDIFQKSKGNEVVKKVNIKDLSGGDNSGVIIKKDAKNCIALQNCSIYEMYVNGIKSGHITFTDEADENGRIFVYGLLADYENSKYYKGIGTELLKLSVEHSKNKGLKGRIGLFADFVPEPTQFYYKNNLRVSPKCTYVEHPELEGMLDYSIRNNIKSRNFKNFPNAIPMTLDEKGAEALLKGERLYKNMDSETLYTTTLDTKHGKISVDIDFCDFMDRKENPCYLIQIIDKKETEDGLLCEQIGTMKIKPASDNNFSYCTIDKISANTNDEKLNRNIQNELLSAAKMLAEELNIVDIA